MYNNLSISPFENENVCLIRPKTLFAFETIALIYNHINPKKNEVKSYNNNQEGEKYTIVITREFCLVTFYRGKKIIVCFFEKLRPKNARNDLCRCRAVKTHP